MDRAGALHAASGGTGTMGLASSNPAAGSALELDWVEMDSELPYNKNRTGVMQQGQLRCYQLGSAMLGRSVNEDDAEKGVWLVGNNSHGSTLAAACVFTKCTALYWDCQGLSPACDTSQL